MHLLWIGETPPTYIFLTQKRFCDKNYRYNVSIFTCILGKFNSMLRDFDHWRNFWSYEKTADSTEILFSVKWTGTEDLQYLLQTLSMRLPQYLYLFLTHKDKMAIFKYLQMSQPVWALMDAVQLALNVFMAVLMPHHRASWSLAFLRSLLSRFREIYKSSLWLSWTYYTMNRYPGYTFF